MGHTWGWEEMPAQNLAVSWAQTWGLVWRVPEGERSAGTPRAARQLPQALHQRQRRPLAVVQPLAPLLHAGICQS